MLKETILFILLSPGLILTIPPASKQLFFSCKTSITAILLHAVLFATLLYYIDFIPGLNRIESFTTTDLCYTSSQMYGSLIGGGLIGAVLAVASLFAYYKFRPNHNS